MWKQGMIIIELLPNVGEEKHLYDSYKVEAFAHKVLRLSPYHCDLHPIKIIWSYVKRHVARENKTFKLNDVMDLTIQGIEKVSVRNWMNCINHATEKEKEMWGIGELSY
ncbi:DDE_3 domain-containing protein [Nephila pilipes]|uniref:DDE_3 domain-containing protein n=1 Tax=Nephila pilipes TaxID=299642 RepID=A0A8X6QED8_NEPPI|nr:DDE_3 domain-containing protein [Nephila pilipes]